MTLESLTAKLLADPEVKKHYDKLTPEFENSMKKIVKNKRKKSCLLIVENIAKDNPDSLFELYELLINFKVKLKNK